MIEQLFGSKTRVKLLQLFYGNPNRAFYVREITRKINEQINSVRRELSNLLSIGIITSETNNNKLYYEVNQQFAHYQALSAMFGGKAATVPVSSSLKPKQQSGEESEIVKDIKALGRIDLAILLGQFTRDDFSSIDLLVVGDINQTKVNHFISDLEDKENKEIRYAIMSPSEYKYRLQINDRFINSVLSAKKQVLINEQDLQVSR